MKNYDTSKNTGYKQSLSLNLGERDCHFINITQIIDNIDFLFFRLSAKEKWIQFTKNYIRKLNIDTLRQVVTFERTYNQYRLYKTSKIFYKWKALLNWRKLCFAAKSYVREDSKNKAFSRSPLKAWQKLAAKAKLIVKQNNTCQALVDRKNMDILFYFYDLWIKKANTSIEIRERAIDNWKILTKQLVTNYISGIKQFYFSRCKYKQKWKLISRILYLNYKHNIMWNEASHVILQKKLKILLKNYILNIKRARLMYEWRHLFIRNQWRHLALREVTIGILKDVSAAQKRLSLECKLKEMSKSLIAKRRIDGFTLALNNHLEEKRKDEIRKWMRKWSMKAQAKAFAWKFLKSHLKGILRDYSNHIQNEAAIKKQRAFRKYIHRRESKRLLITRAFIGWSNITRKLLKKAFVFPDFNVVIYSNINFEVLSLSNRLPELDFDIFRDRIEFKYSENNILANDVGMDAGSLISLSMPFVNTNLDPFKRLRKAVVPQYRTRYNPKIKLDFNFVNQSIENLSHFCKSPQIPINEQFVKRSLPKPRISNRQNVRLRSLLLPLHAISLTKLEDDIRCRTFDENDILPNNLLPQFSFEIQQVNPLKHLKYYQEYVFPKTDERKFHISFDTVIQRAIGHSFIPRFDILRMEVSSLFDRTDIGFDKGAFSIAFDKAVVEPAESTVIKGLSLLDPFAEPGLSLKYSYMRKTVRFSLPNWTDGSPISVRVMSVKLDKPFKNGINRIIERTLPSIIESAMDINFLVSGYKMVIPGNFPQYIGGVAIRESLRRYIPDMFFPFVEPIEISDDCSHSVITTTITELPKNTNYKCNEASSDPEVITITQETPTVSNDPEIPSTSSNSNNRPIRKRPSSSPRSVYRPPPSDDELERPVVKYPMVFDLFDLQLSTTVIVSVGEFTAREFENLNFGWIDEDRITEAENIFTFNEEEEEGNSTISIGSFINDLHICPSSVNSTISDIQIPIQDLAPKPPPVPTITTSYSSHEFPTIPAFSTVDDLPKPTHIPEFPNPLMPPFEMPIVQTPIELPSIDEPKKMVPILLRIQNIAQVDIEPQRKISRPPSPRPFTSVIQSNQSPIVSNKFTNADPIDIPPNFEEEDNNEKERANEESPEPNAIASSSPKDSDHKENEPNSPPCLLPPAPNFPPGIGSPRTTTTTTNSSHTGGSQQFSKPSGFLPLHPPHISQQSDDSSYDDASPETPSTIPSGVINTRPPPPPAGSDSTGTISDEYVTMNLDDVIYDIDDSLVNTYQNTIGYIISDRFVGIIDSLERIDLLSKVLEDKPIKTAQIPKRDPINFNKVVLQSLKQPIMQLIGDIVAGSLPDIATLPQRLEQQSMTELLPEEAESVTASAISTSPQSTSTIESIDIGSLDEAPAQHLPHKKNQPREPVESGIISIDDSPIDFPDRFIRADEDEQNESLDHPQDAYLSPDPNLDHNQPVAVVPSSEELTLSTDEFEVPRNIKLKPNARRVLNKNDKGSLPEITSDDLSLSLDLLPGGGNGRTTRRGERNMHNLRKDVVIISPVKREPTLSHGREKDSKDKPKVIFGKSTKH